MRETIPTDAPLDGAALHEVPKLLRGQWTNFAASDSVLFRWVVAPDEVEWVHTFLDGPMDGKTKVLFVDAPFEVPDAHGFAVGTALLPALTATRVARTEPFTVPAIPRGLPDVEALALLLGAYVRHHAGSWMKNVLLVFEPERVGDERAFVRWLSALVRRLAEQTSGVRVLVLDSTMQLRYEPLWRELGALAWTWAARLELPARVSAVTVAHADLGRFEGALRVMTVRAMQAVNERKIDEATRLAKAAHDLAFGAGAFASVVPIRFAVGNGLAGAGRHVEAVQEFRAAEEAAERAEAAGDPNGLRLRVFARFGVGAMLLGAQEGARLAATYYEDTAPLCQRLGDSRLELESQRVASLAHERAGNVHAAWDAGIRALAVVDRLTAEEREAAMLVPLADALVALTRHRSHQDHRRGLDEQLRRRGMKTSENR